MTWSTSTLMSEDGPSGPNGYYWSQGVPLGAVHTKAQKSAHSSTTRGRERATESQPDDGLPTSSRVQRSTSTMT